MFDDLMTTTSKWRAAPKGSDKGLNDEYASIWYSARVSRVDYGECMFRIEIKAEVADGPEGVPACVGHLVAYRQHTPWVECAIEDGHLKDYFYAFDNISADACVAFQDLLDVESRMKKKLKRAMTFSPPDNLIYVDKIYVHKEFRGHAIARALMAELHDHMAGAPALVFFQAIPFFSAVKAPTETMAWEVERAAGTVAMARHWTADKNLGFCQPGPRSHPQMIVGAWSGEALDKMADRHSYIRLEPSKPIDQVDAQATSRDSGMGEDASDEGDHSSPIKRSYKIAPDPARSMDVYDLSDMALCRIAAEDLRANIHASGAVIEEIVCVRTEVYAAIRKGDEVGAVVLLPAVTNNRDLYFRIISEDLAPYSCAAPLTLLALLSPTTNTLAKMWRKECSRQAGLA